MLTSIQLESYLLDKRNRDTLEATTIILQPGGGFPFPWLLEGCCCAGTVLFTPKGTPTFFTSVGFPSLKCDGDGMGMNGHRWARKTRCRWWLAWTSKQALMGSRGHIRVTSCELSVHIQLDPPTPVLWAWGPSQWTTRVWVGVPDIGREHEGGVIGQTLPLDQRVGNLSHTFIQLKLAGFVGGREVNVG